MKRERLLVTLAAIALCGCEPLRGVVSETDIDTLVDIECVDRALRKAFGTIRRSDYVDYDGNFPNGTEITQFTYYKTEDSAGWATLDVGQVDGKARIIHSFTGVGPELPQQSFYPALRAMEQAGRVLRAGCHLDLSGMELKAVGQRVEALN